MQCESHFEYERLLGGQFLYFEIIFQVGLAAHYAFIEVQRLLKMTTTMKNRRLVWRFVLPQLAVTSYTHSQQGVSSEFLFDQEQGSFLDACVLREERVIVGFGILGARLKVKVPFVSLDTLRKGEKKKIGGQVTLPFVTSMAVTGASLTVRPRLQLLSVGCATRRRPSRTNLASS